MNRAISVFVVSSLLASLLFFAPGIQVAQAFGDHDVGIRNVTMDCSVTWYGAASRINVTVVNNGFYGETVNVTIYTNSSAIGEFDGISLASGSSVVATMLWDGRFPGSDSSLIGAYVISVFVHPVENEANTADNTIVAGTMKVVRAGDVNGDDKVNILDLILVTVRMGKSVPPPGVALPMPWRIDLDNNGKVDILDVGLVALFIYFYNAQR